jgi:hypothetical protein
MPALTVRIFGALALGFLYQFYYSGGDTFNYHTHGSRHIWNALMDDPSAGIKLFFSDATDQTGVYKYSSRILFLRDPDSYFVIKIAAFFDLFTFSSYSATAILFSIVSFTGQWMFFITFYKKFPSIVNSLAIIILFIPSVIFWGSGLLKDTLTIGCLGFAIYSLDALFIKRKFKLSSVVLLIASLGIIYIVKKYILICFIPAAFLWIYAGFFFQIRNVALKIVLIPFIFVVMMFSGYYAILKVGEDDPQYALNKIGQTVQITAYDIGFYTGRDAGSGYSLGELDGSWQSMLRLAPSAINVSLFRPYLWEVRNPLMFLSALESLALFVLTLYTIYRSKSYIFRALSDPTILFCLIFSITFAFAVGVSTFNFGTLARYKIPLLPLYLLGLILILNYSKREVNLVEFERTE